MSLDAELGLDGIPALDLWDLIVEVLGNTTPGLFTQSEDIDIDFRVSGLPHAVVKQAEIFRVRELVKKIESHPHRRALQADLQQNNAYNPFSDESKAMIREMGNVELFEQCETIPKVQCSECLLVDWNQGFVENYCTCGHLLRGGDERILNSRSSQRFSPMAIGVRFLNHREATSSRMGRPRGTRHGKTEAQKEHFVAHNARRRCIKKNFDGSSRSLPTRFNISRFATAGCLCAKIGWTEEKCIEMDKLARRNTPWCIL